MASDSDSDFNWDDERDGVIDDTLDALRDQRDDSQENHLYGTQEFNPQAFTQGKHLVVGPVTFETAFDTQPSIRFGQTQSGVNQQDVPAASSATNYEPFLVEPYVYQWVQDRGTVAGFYIGLYSIGGPPVSNKHVVSWAADGKASVYRDEQTDESWTQPYDYNDADYLTEDTSDTNEYLDDSDDFEDGE